MYNIFFKKIMLTFPFEAFRRSVGFLHSFAAFSRHFLFVWCIYPRLPVDHQTKGKELFLVI